ncbi:hypothetical protein [Marinobacter sp. LV10R520-4]|uniref:hypothetical protein n=1 Tax=Marinobacter sp. LV10R520-4 TaxID=1761796 RepID=UPI000BF9015F|nr:hypothetical protein [Marinobacter sp. LV10R520-4]
MNFETNDDRRAFFSFCDEECETFNREYYAYRLMGNHHHLFDQSYFFGLHYSRVSRIIRDAKRKA